MVWAGVFGVQEGVRIIFVLSMPVFTNDDFNHLIAVGTKVFSEVFNSFLNCTSKYKRIVAHKDAKYTASLPTPESKPRLNHNSDPE